jgi:hypothetical protein
MYSNNKLIRDVADIAAQIMSGKQPVTEKLHPNQQQLDVHEPEKDELTSDDFKKLRGKKEVKKEEVADENARKVDKYLGKKYPLDTPVKKEEVEKLDEYTPGPGGKTMIKGRSYGSSRPEPHAVDTIKGPNDAELKKIEAEKKKKQKKFSEMVNLYQDKGLKSLSEMLAKEEATEDEFNKELDDVKAKDAGKKKNTEIAKGAVQAVKTEETHSTVEVIDLNDVNGVQYSEIELAQERTMTEPEIKKKEEIVKSMKKSLSGFKDRYGDRAKEVMYATATKQAMKD